MIKFNWKENLEIKIIALLLAILLWLYLRSSA